MADRMRVTSLIGGTERFETPLRHPRPGPGAGLGSFRFRARLAWRADRLPFAPGRHPLSIPSAWPHVRDFSGAPLGISRRQAGSAAAPGCTLRHADLQELTASGRVPEGERQGRGLPVAGGLPLPRGADAGRAVAVRRGPTRRARPGRRWPAGGRADGVPPCRPRTGRRRPRGALRRPRPRRQPRPDTAAGAPQGCVRRISPITSPTGRQALLAGGEEAVQAHLAAARRRVRSPAKRAAVDGLAGYFAGQAGRLGYAERLAL